MDAGAGTGGASETGTGGAGGDMSSGTGGDVGGTGGDGGATSTGGMGAGGEVVGAGGAGGEAVGDAGAGGDAVGGSGGAAGAGGSGGVLGSGGAGGLGGVVGTGTGGVAGAAGSGGSGGVGGVVGTGGSGSGGTAAADPDLIVHYKFDENTGSLAADSAAWGGVARNGNVTTFGSGGTATFSTTHQVGTGALALTANGSTGGGYVTIPALSVLAPGAMTIAMWVNVKTDVTWGRLVDVGSSTTNNMILTQHGGAGVVAFAITTEAAMATEPIRGASALSPNAWHHVVVVLSAGSPYTGRLYVDGVESGSNTAMTKHPGDLGATANNWIGRSQFSADPFLDGSVDDFRVYKRALSASEIAALFALR